MHSQRTENLFPSYKLKGNCTFAAQAAIIGNDEAGKDPGAKPEGGGETVISSQGGRSLKQSRRKNQSIEYIICFTTVVELFQKKNRNFIVALHPFYLNPHDNVAQGSGK